MTEVLVVDDEAHIREVVQYALEREGFVVRCAADGRAALDSVRDQPPDLIVLDIMLPELDGLSVCRELRQRSETPILFLSARGEELDRVLGLELGGDDYLTKPFSPRELVARARAILRRVHKGATTPRGDAPPVYLHGPLEVDLGRHEVTVSGKPVSLTPTELGVLSALVERPGMVLSRAQLVERAYSWDNHVTERTVDTHVRRIRAKFRELGEANPIATVHGVGYKASPVSGAR